MPIDPVKDKNAGVLIPVFALKREGDLKIGDTLAFMQAVDFCKRNYITTLQTLPINETSGDNSPYNAISSMALEPVLLAMEPEMVPGLTASDLEEARADVASADDQVIDYAHIKRVKRNCLEKAYAGLMKDSSKLSEFEKFKKEHESWLSPYVLFRALIDYHEGNSNWTSWDDSLKTYGQAAKTVESPQFKSVREGLDLYSYIQWVANSQWLAVKEYATKNNVRLMGDIPFGVSRYSADVWHNQDLFELELSGGAPPEPVFHGDEFTKRWGQNWGIPLYKWDYHRKQDFVWWKARIARLQEHFHDFRIDHVLGFFRVYAFPWTPDRNHEFLELTDAEAEKKTKGILPKFTPRDDESEENRRKNKVEGVEILKHISDTAGDGKIVAEDLGLIVPPYVRPAIHDLGMAGFAIPIFERDEESGEFVNLADLHPLSLTTFATHDHQPLKTYYEELVEKWLGPDGHEGWLEMQRLMRLIQADDNNPPKEFNDEIHRAFMKALLVDTPCWLAVAMITDLLKLDIRFNQPGVAGASSWTQRLDKTLEGYENDPEFAPRIETYKQIIVDSRRVVSSLLKSNSL